MEKTFIKPKLTATAIGLTNTFKPKTPGKVTPQLMQKVIANEVRTTIDTGNGPVDIGKPSDFPASAVPYEEVKAMFQDFDPSKLLNFPPMPEPYRPAVWMNAAEAAKHLKSSVVKLGKLRTLGEGPKCYKQPDGAILYEQYDLDRWVRSMPTIGSEY